MSTTRPGAEPQLSPRRRRLFLGVTLLAPWVLLALVELALRVAGYGSSSPLFVRHTADPRVYAINPAVAERWFRGGPFVPTPAMDLFRAERVPGGLRVFFQGESSAQGFPYGHGAMPSRMLEQRLEATFPGRDVEMVNAAFTAVNSYTLLDQADEIVAQRPDAVLIYTGHNEYYGAFGAGSATGAGRPRAMVKAFLLLRHSRLAQLLHAGVARLTRGGPAAGPVAGDDAPRTVMELMAGQQTVPLGSPRYEAGLAQFRANLAELLARYQAARIPVLVGTVASNERDQPPLDGPASPAAAAFARARTLAAAGDSSGARAAWRDAKERDALRFRAPEAINAIIREEAARHGAIVVETQRALERASPGGVVGASLMLEHLHPNLDGYFLIADAFYEAMRARGIGGAWPDAVPADAARRTIAVTPIDSMVGVLRTDRLTAGWPFRPRGAARTPVVDTLVPRTQVEQLARAVVLGQLPWAEATEQLRSAAERQGDHALALRAARAMAQEFSLSPEPCLDAARAALRLDDDVEALRWAQAAVARQETAAGTQLLGLVLLRRGERAAAIARLRRAAQLAPGDRRALAVLDAAEALPLLEQRRALAPRDTGVLYEIALAYAFTEQGARAREAVAALRRVAPASPRLEALSVIERTGPR